MESLAVLGLLALWGLGIWYYDRVPDQIPTHYGFDGQPDKFGSRAKLWLLPGLGLAIYAFLTLINFRPEGFNFMVKITPENALRQYALATRLNRALKAFVLLLFAVLFWRTLQIAQGEAAHLGWAFLLVPIITLGTAIAYIYRSVSLK